MTYLSKITISFFIIMTLSSTFSLAMEISSDEDAINVSGKQRMLTQQILRDYCMVGMKLKFGKPKENLKKIVNEYETNLKSLMLYTKNESIKENLKKIKIFWAPLKQLVLTTPVKKDAIGIEKALVQLLEMSDDVTKLFVQDSDNKLGEIINISGRQRMLSQRILALYMLKAWGINNDDLSIKLNESIALFEKSLKKLMLSELSNDEILILLKNIKRPFMYIKMQNTEYTTKFTPSLVYKKSTFILDNINRATLQYASNKINKKENENENEK